MSLLPNGLTTAETECAVFPQLWATNLRALDRFLCVSGDALPDPSGDGGAWSVPAGGAPWLRSTGAAWSAWARPGAIFLSAAGGSTSVPLDVLEGSVATEADPGVPLRLVRTDNNGAATLTVTVPSGDSLDGVTDGSLTIPVGEGRTVAGDGSGAWWIIGG